MVIYKRNVYRFQCQNTTFKIFYFYVQPDNNIELPGLEMAVIWSDCVCADYCKAIEIRAFGLKWRQNLQVKVTNSQPTLLQNCVKLAECSKLPKVQLLQLPNVPGACWDVLRPVHSVSSHLHITAQEQREKIPSHNIVTSHFLPLGKFKLIGNS